MKITFIGTDSGDPVFSACSTVVHDMLDQVAHMAARYPVASSPAQALLQFTKAS